MDRRLGRQAREADEIVDRGSIVLVVYVAFSEGMRNHIWSQVSAGEVIAVAALATALVVVMLIVTGALPPRLGFDRADTIAIHLRIEEEPGRRTSHGDGAVHRLDGGLIVLPLMIFHQIQLILCGMLASRYAKRPDPEVKE